MSLLILYLILSCSKFDRPDKLVVKKVFVEYDHG